MIPKFIKFFIVTNFLMFCFLIYVFTEYVFSSNLDQAYRLGYSFLINLPLSIFTTFILTMIPTILAKFLIHFLFIPYYKFQNKLQFYNFSSHQLHYCKNYKKYYKNIYFLKLLSTDKIIGNILLQSLSYQSMVIEPLSHQSKVIEPLSYEPKGIKLFSHEINFINKNYIGRNNCQENFSMYINFKASDDELLGIVSNIEINNIIENVKNKNIEKLLKKEEYFIELYLKYKEHPMIIKEIRDFTNSGLCKNNAITFPSHKICWLENFEKKLIESEYFYLQHSDYINKEKEKRNNEYINVYRMYIRNNDLVKKLLYLRDKEIMNIEKNYGFDGPYII